MNLLDAHLNWLSHKDDPQPKKPTMNEKLILESILHTLRIGLRNAERSGNSKAVQGYKNTISEIKKEMNK